VRVHVRVHACVRVCARAFVRFVCVRALDRVRALF
jgi:hypothetical protein